jgi:Protein of unknown function DUF262
MSDLSAIKITPENIAHMLADGFWSVPRYQRGYKWKEQQVNDLLNDIENAIQEKQAEYFLGSIVVATGEDGSPEIVDGQQRLATVAGFWGTQESITLPSGLSGCFANPFRDSITASRPKRRPLKSMRVPKRDESARKYAPKSKVMPE